MKHFAAVATKKRLKGGGASNPQPCSLQTKGWGLTLTTGSLTRDGGGICREGSKGTSVRLPEEVEAAWRLLGAEHREVVKEVLVSQLRKVLEELASRATSETRCSPGGQASDWSGSLTNATRGLAGRAASWCVLACSS